MDSQRYLKSIDKKLRRISYKKINISFNIEELITNRLEYIHALDLFIRKKVIERKREKDSISSITDGKNVKIIFRDGMISRYICECNNGICKHIIATLIAYEREQESFLYDINSELSYIINHYKDILEMIKENEIKDDIELLQILHSLILNNDSKILQHLIALMSLNIISAIDKKYDIEALRLINESIGDNINKIIGKIRSSDETINKNDKVVRSWDDIITELVGRNEII
ncbi:MAG: hypothetical protein QW416_07695 [Candidatus Nitrosocaldaceae archaeon]